MNAQAWHGRADRRRTRYVHQVSRAPLSRILALLLLLPVGLASTGATMAHAMAHHRASHTHDPALHAPDGTARQVSAPEPEPEHQHLRIDAATSSRPDGAPLALAAPSRLLVAEDPATAVAAPSGYHVPRFSNGGTGPPPSLRAPPLS